jgi:hypothetical protein
VWKGDLASYGFLLQVWSVHKFAFKIKIDDKNTVTITETIRLHRLCWFGHVQRTEENRIPKRVLYSYMNLETTRTTGRPRKMK